MQIAPLHLLYLLGAGALTGILGALLGTGGGVLLIPVLLLGFGLPMHNAVATSIISVVATSTAVASVNVERGTANMRLGMVLEIATALGALAGGLTAHLLSASTLEIIFAIALLPTAILMWRGVTENASSAESTLDSRAGVLDLPPETSPLAGRYFDPQLGREIVYRVRRIWAGLGISFLAGNLSGLLGIGGGVFKVPALHLACGVPIKAAAATSNFMIGVTATTSAFLYFGHGEVWPALTAAVILGVLAGSAVGSVVSPRLKGAVLTRLFAVVLLGVAIQMFFRVFWKS